MENNDSTLKCELKPDKPTEKQLRIIKYIYDNLDMQFSGTTKEEASRFISENIEKSKKKGQETRQPS